MNKTEFVNFIAEKNDITKVEAKKCVDVVTDAIVAALEDGDEVNLMGFGKFSVVHKDASTARNLQTGETMTVPAHNSPKFSFSKAVKETVR